VPQKQRLEYFSKEEGNGGSPNQSYTDQKHWSQKSWGKAIMRMMTAAAVACLSVVGLAAATDAQAVMQHYDLDIPQERLDVALRELAQQTGLQIASFTDSIDGSLVVGPVKGSRSAEDALKVLLAPSGLTFKLVSEKTIAILNPKDTRSVTGASLAPSAESGAGARRADEAWRVAQSDSTGKPENKAASVPSEEGTGARLEEIVVTAQLRKENLIDVPISIVAIGADELKNRNITRLDDLPYVVPGLAVETDGFTHRMSLRGISNLFGGNSSLIGLYLDDADVTGSSYVQPELNTYDLERVEVLRGPQGTLYGNGSAGGVIRFVTKSPDLHDYQMTSDVTALFTERGAPGQRIETAVNAPLIDDVLAIRVAGEFYHDGGWIDQPAADRQDINAKNLTDVRFKMLWKPAEGLTATALAEVHRNDMGLSTGEDANGNYTQVFGLTTTPRIIDDFDIFNFTLTYDFSGVQVLNTTSYFKQNNTSEDIGTILPFAPPNSPPPTVADLYVPRDLRTSGILTEELRFASSDPGPWQWTIGANYRRFRYQEGFAYYYDVPGPLPPPDQTYPSYTDNVSKSWAGFADTSYKLMSRLTLGAGLRYFHDDQSFVSSPPPTTQTGTFKSTDPRAYIDLKVMDGLNVYGSAAKGFRSGGFNQLNQPSYGPENIWTYELGAKSSFTRFSIDGAVFYSDYKGYQIVGNAPPPAPQLNIYSNAGDALIEGVELGGVWRPVNGWTLSFDGDVLKTEFYKITTPVGADYAVGDNLDLVPKYTFTGSVQRNFIVSGHEGLVRLDYSQKGKETYRLRAVGPWYFSESDVNHTLNLNASLNCNKNLRIGAFIQNLTDDRGYIDPTTIQANGSRLRPRTYGLDFGLNVD